jgi:hypothetical protein
MSRSLRLFASALVLAAVACAAPAAAQRYGANPKPKQEEGVPVPPMRGPEPKPEASKAPAAPSPIMSPAPYFEPLPDTTPRIGGLDERPTGGGRCRTSCAQDYYRCLSGDGMSICGPAWSRCLISCPSVSSSD